MICTLWNLPATSCPKENVLFVNKQKTHQCHINLITSPGDVMSWASAKGLSSQCPVAFPLRVLLLGEWEAQTKSFFHGRTLGLLQPGNQPTPGALPFREPGRVSILLGTQVGTRTVRVQCMKPGTQSRRSGQPRGTGWGGGRRGLEIGGRGDPHPPVVDSC